MKHRRPKFTAVYIRVSTRQQSHRSQVVDLKRYVDNHREELGGIKVFKEKFTGRTMNRPQWRKLESHILAHRVSHLLVWRIDRLGRTLLELVKLFEMLQKHKCNLISLKENIDLSTVTGRMLANILASFANYDNEQRAERILAGQAAAKAAGKTIGGSKKGSLYKITMEQVKLIVDLKAEGVGVTEIAKTVNTSTVNVYRILRRIKDGDIKLA